MFTHHICGFQISVKFISKNYLEICAKTKKRRIMIICLVMFDIPKLLR